MSKMADLSYDIEQLYIEGFSPISISVQLGCPLDQVLGWLKETGVAPLSDTEVLVDYYGA